MKKHAPTKISLETPEQVMDALKIEGAEKDTLILIWRPQYRLFLAQQSMIILGIMGVATTINFFMGGTYLFPLFMFAGLTLWAFFLDQDDWRGNKNKVWALTDRNLFRLSTNPMDEVLALRLDSIDRITDWGMWKLYIRTKEIKIVDLSYVGRASEIYGDLDKAMQNATPPTPKKGLL